MAYVPTGRPSRPSVSKHQIGQACFDKIETSCPVQTEANWPLENTLHSPRSSKRKLEQVITVKAGRSSLSKARGWRRMPGENTHTETEMVTASATWSGFEFTWLLGVFGGTEGDFPEGAPDFPLDTPLLEPPLLEPPRT